MEVAPNVQSAELTDLTNYTVEVMRIVDEKGRLETEEKRIKTQNEQLVEDKGILASQLTQVVDEKECLKKQNEQLVEVKGILASRLTQVLDEKRVLEMENTHEKDRLEKQIVQLQEDKDRFEKELQPLRTQVQQLQAEVQDIQQKRRNDLDAALDRVRNRSWRLGDFSLLCDLVIPESDGGRRRERKRSLTLYEHESVATPPKATDQTVNRQAPRKKKRAKSASAAEDPT